jgi:hypothetical protein
LACPALAVVGGNVDYRVVRRTVPPLSDPAVPDGLLERMAACPYLGIVKRSHGGTWLRMLLLASIHRLTGGLRV